MAIAEEYLLKFKGDTSDLNRKLGQTQAQVGGLMGKVGGLTKGFGGLAAALGAVAIVNKFKNIAIEMDNIADAAERVGVNVEQFSALNYAAEMADVSMGALEASIRKMQVALNNAAEGSPAFLEAFQKIGINFDEIRSQNPEEQFIQIASAVAAIEDPAKRTATAIEIFGRGGTGIINMANQGAAALRELTQEARETGKAFDEEAAEKAGRFDKELKKLDASVDGLFMILADSGVIDAFSFIVNNAGDTVRYFADGVGVLKNELLTLLNLTKEEKFGDLVDDTSNLREQINLIKQKGNLDADGKKELVQLQDQLVKKQAELYDLGKKTFAISGAGKAIAGTSPDRPLGKTPIADTIKPDLDKVAKDLEDAIPKDKIQNDITDAFEGAFDNISVLSGDFKTDMSNLFLKLGSDIAKATLSPLASQLGNSFGSLLGSSGGGLGGIFSSLSSGLGDLLSFDGGGSTGSGSRSGGVDGKGGFLSVLHPNETVLDHTKGQGMSSGGVTVQQYNSNTFTSDMDIDRRIKAHQPILVDATRRAVLSALQNGGEGSRITNNRL